MVRGRLDTIRCIVANLVGDKESGDSLVDVDEPAQPLSQVQMEDYSDPNWEPEPIDAAPGFRTNKPSDTISTLVSIYDSKDLFIKELQVLLAQRLLAIQDGNFDNEVSSSPPASTPGFPSHYLFLAQWFIAEEHRDPQSSVWGSTVAGVRSHVEGYDGFETDRPAYPSAERGSICPSSGYAFAERRIQCVLHSTISGRLYKGIS